MAKELWSIFTDDMNRCIITGRSDHIERHHIFAGRLGLRTKSEAYGFVVPLHASVHPNGAFCTAENWKEIDNQLKRECQRYYEEHYSTREDWYREFGQYYDWEGTENDID